MSIPDEVLMAYVDGELPAEERARIEAAMQSDADVARRVAQQKKLRTDLRAAFDGVLREPVPERLLAAARGEPAIGRDAASGNHDRRTSATSSENATSDMRAASASAESATSGTSAASRVSGTPPCARGASVSDFAAAAQARKDAREARTARRWSWPEWGAMAASLVIGVIIAQFALRSPGSAPFISQQGQLLAQGDLARTLTEQLASTQATGADTAVGVSFRTKDGSYCRSFTMRSSSTAGLACREGDAWRVDVLARTDNSSGEYAQAGSALPAAVLSAIEQQIDGEPLDAAAEVRAREADWRGPPAQ
jgi:hypothetical protein